MTRILVVDDDPLFGQMLMEWLTEQGFDASRVTSAEDALKLVGEIGSHPDIFLVDERLGSELSGVEFISRVREIAPESDAILFTGAMDPGIARRARLAGAWCYLHRPFDSEMLGFELETLLEWRKGKVATSERDWLRVLNRIVERLQQANTVQQVGQLLVEGGVELGFDRVRFYRARLVDGAPTLFGVCQSGVNPVLEFDRVVYPLEKTIYGKAAYAQRKPTFFRDQELGPTFLSALVQAEGRPESLGEYVIIPLFSGDECLGFLNMDNCRKAQAIHPTHKDLLRLFAGQAVNALERALRYEQEQQERQVDEMIRRILAHMGDPAEKESLDRLLRAIHDELAVYAPMPNFIAVFRGRETNGYYTRLHIESGIEHKPYWRPNSEKGMVWCILNYATELFLPLGTREHREKYGLQQVGTRPAHSWMGVPLRIGTEVMGALIVEDDDSENVFHQEHFEMFLSLAARLAGVIQTAWLHEQEKKHSHLLYQLQEASELIPGFDEEKLWLTALTLCTADYGANFDRAMLFLAKEGGTQLRGRMAIGHLRKEDAEAEWEKNARIGMNWKEFLDALQTDTLKLTGLDRTVRDYTFGVNDGEAFSEALHQNKIVILSSEDAPNRLPSDFLARFGITSYCLVPVKAGEQTMGVVVLDNIWGKGPNRLDVLEILDNLTNQAALVYENLRKSRSLEYLIAVQHEVLVQSTVRPLQETLQRICEAARNITGGDMVAIYPLQDNGEELCYDHRHSARVGRRTLANRSLNHMPNGLSRHVLLEAKHLVLIPDVAKDVTLYYGEWHRDAPIVRDEGIRATIVTPVFGLRTGKPQAILYIDYHSPRTFIEHDLQIAEAFAHLIATAIGNWRDAQGLRDTQEARERELSLLSEVLAGALTAESDERQITQFLLKAVPTLFEPLTVTTGITLKEWQRPNTDADPTEMHRFIYLQESDLKERIIPARENRAINSRAISTGTLQNVFDVNKDADYAPRYGGTRAELDVPIIVDGQVVGALNIESSQLSAFTKHHEEMAQRFAHVAALALGNVRRQRNLRTVLGAVNAMTAPANLSDTLRQIADGIRQAVPNLSNLTIWYKEPHTGHLRLADSFFGIRNPASLIADQPRPDGAVHYALTLNQPMWVENLDQNKRFASKSLVVKEGIRSTAVFPLRAQDEAVGIMFFNYRESHRFTNEEKRLYPILAEVVAASIQDALLLEKSRIHRLQVEREGKRFQMVLDITETVSKELDQEEVIRKILTRIQQDDLFPNTITAVLRYNNEENSLVLTSSSLPFYFPEVPEHPTIPSVPLDGTSIVATVARRSQASKQKEFINKGNVQDNPDYLNLRPNTQSELAVSLSSEEKGLIGVLVLESTQSNAFDEDAVQTVNLLARQIGLAMERSLEREELEVNNTVATATAWATEIAHDIEAAIFNIRSGVDALREITNELGTPYLDRIDASAQRLITATPPESQMPESILIDEYLRTIVERLVIEMDRNIETAFIFGCQSLEIESYPLGVERILRHLLRNAGRAMQNQAERKVICIETQILREHNSIEIRVADTGPGIPPQQQHLLFRRRVPRSESGYGGMGLMLVHFLLKTIGGSIRLLPSRPGWGATFAIRLPLQTQQNTRTDLEVKYG